MLLFEEKISSNRAAFIQKVIEISKRLDIDPNWLMVVMNFETAGTFSPSIQNKTSRATGLIQFMPATAISLGTTVDQLAKMSNVEQLTWVEKYLSRYSSKMVHLVDVYLAVFFPRAMNKAPEWEIHSDTLSADTIARQNPVFDVIKRDGKITVAEVTQVILSRVPQAYWESLKKKWIPPPSSPAETGLVS